MQSGDGTAGRGRGPTVAPPPPGLSSSPANASPSSSSSAVSAPRNPGFDLLPHHQQQLLIMRQQQLQQVRKPEQDNLLAYKLGSMHGVISGNNFPSSSGIPTSNISRNSQLNYARQLHEKKQSGHALEQQPNSVHHPYAQFSMHATQSQQKLHGSIPTLLESEIGIMGPPIGRQQKLVGNTKVQENVPAETGNQTQLSKLPNPANNIRPNDQQNEQIGQKNELKKAPKSATVPANVIKPVQLPQSQGSMGSIVSNQLMLAQLQAMQAWAIEHNIDLSHPANANLIAQVLPILQSNRLAALQKTNAGTTPIQQPCLSASNPQINISSPATSENSAQGNLKTNLTGQAGLIRSGVGTVLANLKNMKVQETQPAQTSVNQVEASCTIHPPQHLMSSSQSFDLSIEKKSDFSQMQFFSQQSPKVGNLTPQTKESGLLSQKGSGLAAQQLLGFTKQQLHVLKAQILAFRRLKRGEISLPPEVLQSITPSPLEFHPQAALPSPNKPGKLENNTGQVYMGHKKNPEESNPQLPTSNKSNALSKEGCAGNEKAPDATPYMKVDTVIPRTFATGKVPNIYPVSVKPEQDTDPDSSFVGENDASKGKLVPDISTYVDGGSVKKHLPANASVQSNVKTYNGPLFDMPFYASKYDLLGPTMESNPNSYTFSYDIKELLDKEGKEVLKKKRTLYLKKLGNFLASNLGRKKIKPDLVLRLQIEEKKLRLLDIQMRLREEVDEQQQEIMALPDRPYRKFVRQCERQRSEFIRQLQQLQKATKEKQLKSIFQWRKKLLESHWAIRDARTARNRGVAKYHEKMLREFSKRKDDDRNKRLEALKNNDVDRYREILLEQQTSIPGDAAQRYTVLSSFLLQTEEYLHKLGTKISTLKKQQDVDEAVNAAATAARSQGYSEGEAKAIVASAREEVMIRNSFSEINVPRDGSSVNKYYNLAHAVNERVLRQPSMLRTGTLRDYQLVGLQWMLSLYNNKLNGILADEMGLGKTVQVMALIAYLMEFKGNNGPHLIIVPNAVLVNWKSELHSWLPSASCIFYVGTKDERSRLFSHEVCALKFNVLVTTYEFIMYDRSRLSKIDWKYIIIDEAQRMKDRESVLARDLDRYRCQRRLLLTGTPLQNDLKELWSLLNLLLPEVFDNRKSFHDWFSKPFQKDGSSHNQEEDDWLETEKKVIVIHRLHQILEPFMLRRRVEDVEGSLPPKVSVVLRCRMSALQGAIYDWIKCTGTIRVDPEDELRKAERNPTYQIKMFKNLNNKCMELRKACNHPLLNYPYFNDYSKEFLIRSCGKLWILDRILLKLHRAGHRVLLFSTMTKLLDILEEYLQWRQLIYRRIDGSTSLEDRESAIVDFNRPASKCFIFLLSIRAAGRGLNLQTADTVVIYDPDPNPQNEEQAVARAHRIGQTREVKVIYMEAVVDKISSYQKEDEVRNGGCGDSEDDELTSKHRYTGSIESLIRNNIQQYKIDMADEVINAGRFDQRTTHEERRMTLETLLHDEERYQETLHDVPSLSEVNRMIARSDEEVELFDQMDDELDWTGEMTKHNQVPTWLRAGSKELNAFIARLNKKTSKNVFGSVVDFESDDLFPGLAASKAERRRARPNNIKAQKYSPYVEYDDDDEDFDAGSDEGNEYSLQEEDRETEYMEEEDLINRVADLQGDSKDLLEEGELVCNDDGLYVFSDAIEGRRNPPMCEEAGSTGSSFGNRRVQQPISSSISLRKFGSLSELDARTGVLSAKLNELEEGEIAVSGDSRIQQSGSWNHDRDDGEYEQVLQPILKRKRSKRLRPGHATERMEEKSDDYRSFSRHESRLPAHIHHDSAMNSRVDGGGGPFLRRNSPTPPSLKHKSTFQTRRDQVTNNRHNSVGSSYLLGCEEDARDRSRESWNGRATHNAGPDFIGRNMSDSMQRKCKNVISKLQRRIEKEGCQLVPLLYDLWKKNDSSNPTRKYSKASSSFNLSIIDRRVDNLEYSGVEEFIANVQSMLKNAVQLCKYSHEAKYEARKLQDIFFHIMKIAFPDSDFHDAKMALTFPSSSQVRADATPRLKPWMKKHSPPKPLKRIPTPNFKPNPQPPNEGRGGVNNASRFEKDASSILGPLLTHPGDLVVCKKKRKDRDKALTRPKMGMLSPTNPSQASTSLFRPVVSKNEAVIRPPANFGPPAKHKSDWVNSVSRGEDIEYVASGMEELQWARTVKRMRSDTMKRRPNL